MQATAAAKPIARRVVEPAPETDNRALNPTATRYGWCPFGDINLVNADGTINLYVQPLQIGDGVENPYHRRLPKCQLIPFPTFTALEQVPSSDHHDSNGRALLETTSRQINAKSAAEQVLERYSGWGFVLLDSLQGVDQDLAFRIFQVVQPLEWRMQELENELAFGAPERIDAIEPITFGHVPDYSVQPLRTDYERGLAREVARELLDGLSVALSLANETLNNTETSMTTRFAGGHGKTGPDPLDQRLSEELGRPLPKLVGQQKSNADEKLDFLVNKEIERSTKEENELLRAENARLRAGSQQTADSSQQSELPAAGVLTQPMTVCGHIKSTDGQPCQIQVPVGGRCHLHKDKE